MKKCILRTFRKILKMETNYKPSIEYKIKLFEGLPIWFKLLEGMSDIFIQQYKNTVNSRKYSYLPLRGLSESLNIFVFECL